MVSSKGRVTQVSEAERIVDKFKRYIPEETFESPSIRIELETAIAQALQAKQDEIERLQKNMCELIEELDSYAKSDYKGEWNDADGGFSARLMVAKMKGANQEELDKIRKEHDARW